MKRTYPRKREYSLTIMLFIFLTTLILVNGCATLPELGGPKVCYGKTCWNVELAVTSDQHTKGLMYRKNLSEEGGMLFVFSEEDIYPFWMKNTWIQLDMIWLDSNMTIVHIENRAEPCVAIKCPGFDPGAKALYVLEVIGGTAEQYGMKVGDKLLYDK
jgi:uncharacterized membrane protein (UPF0127 family)